MINKDKQQVTIEIFNKVKIVLLTILIAVIIRSFVFRVAVSNGDSMSPTIQHKDVLVLSKIPYIFGSPTVGDVVVFPYQENMNDKYIKRIVADGGDIIDIRNGIVYINDKKLEDEFNYNVTSLGNISYPFTVPEDKYFCLGDNRNASKDSRYIEVGTMMEKDFLGKVVFRLYPFDSMFESFSEKINY